MLHAQLFSKTPAVLSRIYPDCFWKGDVNKKVLHLTFDDGPDAETTPFILDTLKRFRAKVTFFCTGEHIEAHPEIFRRTLNEGHHAGNHTYRHMNGWKYKNQIYYDDVTKCDQILSAFPQWKIKAGSKPLFRPPYGKLKPSQYRHLKSNYNIVMWDILTYDFDKRLSRNAVLRTVLKNAGGGSVIVFHDSLKALPRMEYALPKVLEHFTEKGYRFEPIGYF